MVWFQRIFKRGEQNNLDADGMNYTSPEFLKTFHKVRWETAGRTFGNDHSTLIGILVDWWIRLSHKNYALESGPSVGGGKKGKGRGNCDAMFLEKQLEKEQPVGLLEVEGPKIGRWKWCAEKIRRFLDEYKSLQFAILLTYSYAPKGRGVDRKVKQISFEDIFPCLEAKKIWEQFTDKGIIVIILNKEFEKILNKDLIRARNDYYQCIPKTIEGTLVVNSKNVGREIFWPK